MPLNEAKINKYTEYAVVVRKTGGSHVVFDHDDWVELLCVPAHRPINLKNAVATIHHRSKMIDALFNT